MIYLDSLIQEIVVLSKVSFWSFRPQQQALMKS